MIHRTFDAGLHNSIANKPGIHEWVSNPSTREPIDLSPIAHDTKNFVLLHNGEDGAMVFQWTGPNIWEAHILFLHSCRGKRAITVGHEMFGFMFSEIGATHIWGQISIKNRAAHWYARRLGAKDSGHRQHPAFGECLLFLCSKSDWELVPR